MSNERMNNNLQKSNERTDFFLIMSNGQKNVRWSANTSSNVSDKHYYTKWWIEYHEWLWLLKYYSVNNGITMFYIR